MVVLVPKDKFFFSDATEQRNKACVRLPIHVSCLISSPTCLISNWIINLKNVNLFMLMWSEFQARGPRRTQVLQTCAERSASTLLQARSRERGREQGSPTGVCVCQICCVQREKSQKARLGEAGLGPQWKILDVGWSQRLTMSTDQGRRPRNRGSTGRKRGVASEGLHRVRRMEMCL